MKKQNIINIDLLRSKVKVSFAKTCKEAREELTTFLCCEIDGSRDNAIAGFAIANGRRVVVWIGPQCKRQQIFHECYHACHRLLKEINAEATDEELNAHLMEYIAERVLILWERENSI